MKVIKQKKKKEIERWRKWSNWSNWARTKKKEEKDDRCKQWQETAVQDRERESEREVRRHAMQLTACQTGHEATAGLKEEEKAKNKK